MIRALFWAALAGLVYSYAIFPAITVARALLWPRPHRRADVSPTVTVVIAARNEAGGIARKLESVLRQDYPASHLSVIVASDGSYDGTAAAAHALDAPNVRVLDLPRVGKGDALRAGVAEARSDILVFSDANSVFAPDAVRQLVRGFADATVGGVAGNQVYAEGRMEDATSVGERSYWSFDRTLKEAQSRAGNVIAATGALYAIRSGLFRPIPHGVTDDFYLSLAVIDAGYRMVFEPDAVAYEAVAPSRRLEYGRKVRIMTRGLRCVVMIPRVLDPRRTGFYAVQLFSHKVLMRLMAMPLAVLALTSVLLYRRGLVYRLATWSQLTFYGLGGAGLALARRPLGHRPMLALPAYFCLVQAASLHATWNLWRGRTYDRWEPTRERPQPASAREVEEEAA